jgi:hypothetical protein
MEPRSVPYLFRRFRGGFPLFCSRVCVPGKRHGRNEDVDSRAVLFFNSLLA